MVSSYSPRTDRETFIHIKKRYLPLDNNLDCSNSSLSYQMKPLDFSTFPVLETDRLVLRRLSLEDAPVIYQLCSDVDVAALTGNAPFLHINEAIHTLIK